MAFSLEDRRQSTSTNRLSRESIKKCFHELDKDGAGSISRSSIEAALLEVYRHLTPILKPYHVIHPSRSNDWIIYLDSLFPSTECKQDDNYDLSRFIILVESWKLPSINWIPAACTSYKTSRTIQDKISQKLQQIRSSCLNNVHRHVFVAIVLALLIGLALWQFFTFYYNDSARAAFMATGALYPTLFLMILSMSRWTQHLLLQSKYLRRIVNWEYAQSFHIKMACLSFLLGIIHSIAHMAGSYRHAIHHLQALRDQLTMNGKTVAKIPNTYLDLMQWRASWTGLTALGLFTIMSICGSAPLRRRYFELFQWSHMLMYPLFAMLLAHGSGAILKQPILGWWLLLPILLVFTEMMYRIYRGFLPLEATVLLVEGNMVAISIKVRNKLSRFRPGQYIYLQIPSISRFQWHPFTVSKISSDSIIIHIRTSAGDWTSALYQEAIRKEKLVVAMEGPYGSPTREFYRYDHTIIIGAGIGITPFSAILFDLFDKLSVNKSPWIRRIRKESTTKADQSHRHVAENAANEKSKSNSLQVSLEKKSISLHWTVRTLEDLQWLSILLNQMSSNLMIKINIHLYVTQCGSKGAPISEVIFRSLLDHHRVASLQTTSVLTGLLQTCQFIRPDLEEIMNTYNREYCSMDIQSRPRKVGVIYCGPVSLGRILSAKCQYLNNQARVQGARLCYYFHSESF